MVKVESTVFYFIVIKTCQYPQVPVFGCFPSFIRNRENGRKTG